MSKGKEKVEQQCQRWGVAGHSFRQARVGLLEKEVFE